MYLEAFSTLHELHLSSYCCTQRSVQFDVFALKFELEWWIVHPTRMQDTLQFLSAKREVPHHSAAFGVPSISR